jgi:hypothetical protein
MHVCASTFLYYYYYIAMHRKYANHYWLISLLGGVFKNKRFYADNVCLGLDVWKSEFNSRKAKKSSKVKWSKRIFL